MAKFQLIVYYAQYGADWTEEYYVDGPGNAVAATDLGDIWRNRRKAFSDKSLVIKAVEARNVLNNRDAFTRPLVHPPAGGQVEFNPDITGTSIKMKILAVNGRSRFVSLSGLSDKDTIRHDDGSPDFSAFILPVGSFFAKCQELNFCVRSLKAVAAEGILAWQPVNTVGPNATNPLWTTITMAAGGTAPTRGMRIYFRGNDRNQFPQLKGSFVVMDTPVAGVFNIGLRWRGAAAAVAVQNLQFRQQDYDYSPFDKRFLVDYVSVKRADPTNRRRGRRKTPSLRR